MKDLEIEMVRAATVGDYNLGPGDTVQLPEEVARALIARGLAVEAAKAGRKKSTGGDDDGKEK